MAKGATLSEGSGGENISHFSTIRIRATGKGNLRMKVFSLDFVREKELVSFPLQSATRIQPNRIVNFVEQRACFDLFTTEMDEHVKINRIIVYMKEIYTSHPGA